MQMVPQAPAPDAVPDSPPLRSPPTDQPTSAYNYTAKSHTYFASYLGRNHFPADLALSVPLALHTQGREGRGAGKRDHADEKASEIGGLGRGGEEEGKERYGAVNDCLHYAVKGQSSEARDAESAGGAELEVVVKEEAGKGKTWTWGLDGLRKRGARTKF